MYKANSNIVYDCKYHIIWCPKYRKPVLVGDVEKMLRNILPLKANELGAEIIKMETDKDYVHLLISCNPQFGIHSQTIQAITDKFDANRKTISELRKSGNTKAKHPYKIKKFYVIPFKKSAISINSKGNLKLTMSKGRYLELDFN